MSKLCWCACLLFFAALTLGVTGASPGSAIPQADASGSDQSSEALVVQSSAGAEHVLWLRLRWLLAGGSACSIVVVVVRQLRQLATQQPTNGFQPGTSSEPGPTMTPRAPDWSEDPYGAVAGD